MITEWWPGPASCGKVAVLEPSLSGMWQASRLVDVCLVGVALECIASSFSPPATFQSVGAAAITARQSSRSRPIAMAAGGSSFSSGFSSKVWHVRKLDRRHLDTGLGQNRSSGSCFNERRVRCLPPNDARLTHQQSRFWPGGLFDAVKRGRPSVTVFNVESHSR